MKLQSSVKKQKLKFMQQTYKLDAQKETLKKLSEYIQQQEGNVGSFTAFDKEKFAFLQKRKQEELDEARVLHSISMSSLNVNGSGAPEKILRSSSMPATETEV